MLRHPLLNMAESKDILVKFELDIEKQNFEFVYKPLEENRANVIEYDAEKHDILIKGFNISPSYNIKVITFLADFFNNQGQSGETVAAEQFIDAIENHLNLILSTDEYESTALHESKDEDDNDDDSKDKGKDDNNEEKDDKNDDKSKEPYKKGERQTTTKEVKKDMRVKRVESKDFSFRLDIKRLLIRHQVIVNRAKFEKVGKHSFIITSKDVAKHVDWLVSKTIKGWVNGIELKPANEVEFFSRIFPQIKVEIDFK